MKLKSLFTLAVLSSIAIPVTGLAGAKAKLEMKADAQVYPPNNSYVCTLSGPPPTDIQYEVLARIVATKRTYGSVDELFAPMVREVRMIGADAIINLQVGQRFKGPLPWRITSPTGDGQAIKVLADSESLDCLGMGGRLWGPGGPILNDTAETGAPSTEATGSPSEAHSKGTPTVDMYEELLKLDDLRERGILTDAEFQVEKKKLLDSD